MPIDLSVDELLTTTRSVRKRLDVARPVAREVIEECLELAVQAPCGSNREPWHWVVVTDANQRAGLAELYLRTWREYETSDRFAGKLFADDPERAERQHRVGESARHLADILADVPVMVVPCVTGRPYDSLMGQMSQWGSIMPAIWSFMLAARSRGLGTVLTGMHLPFEVEAAELLGIPHEEVTQTAMIPVAYYTGDTFKPARRKPLSEVLHWDRW